MLSNPFLQSGFRLTPQLRRFGLGERARGLPASQEGRQNGLALQRPVGAAAGDLKRVVERFGQIGEQLAHLRAGLEIMLRTQAAPFVDGNVAPRGDADQRIMRFEIVGLREIGLVGGDDRQVEFVSEIEQLRLHRSLLRQTMALDLHIEPVAEDRLKRLDARAGKLGAAVNQRAVDRSFQSAGQRDQAFGARRQIGDGGNHLAGLACREIGVGREPHQIGIALRVLGEERDAPVGARPVRFNRTRRIALAREAEREGQADQRLDARFGHGFGKFERAEQVVGVGQGQRRRTVGPSQGGEFRNSERAFEQRIG